MSTKNQPFYIKRAFASDIYSMAEAFLIQVAIFNGFLRTPGT
jgi:hypothetical protein